MIKQLLATITQYDDQLKLFRLLLNNTLEVQCLRNANETARTREKLSCILDFQVSSGIKHVLVLP